MAAFDVALLVGLSVAWGFSYHFIETALRSFSPILLAAIRFDVVGLVILAIAAVRAGGLRQVLPRGNRVWAAIAVGGVLNIALYHAFLFWAQTRATAGIASLIVGMNPILTIVASKWLLPGEHVDRRSLLGLALGFAGFVALGVLREGSILDGEGIAEFAILAAIVAWALGTVTIRRVGQPANLLMFVAWQALVGAFVLHAMSAAFETPRLATDTTAWLCLAYLVVVASCIGLPVFFTLLRRIGPLRSNLVSYGSAVMTAVVGVLVFDKPIELRAGVAFALIVAGFALVATSGTRRAAPPVAQVD